MMTRICGYSLVALGLLLLGCMPEPTQSTGEQKLAALDRIDSERLEAHVAFLSDDELEGRKPGDAGYSAAATYVAEQLAAMGVAPAGVDDWYQPVSLRNYGIDIQSASFVIHRDGEALALRYRDDFSIGGDEVRAEIAVHGEVVYVGYGIHAPEYGYSDYDGVDVHGKIVAFFDGAPPQFEGNAGAHYSAGETKKEALASRGAVGFISLRSKKDEERRPWDEIKKRFGKRPSTTWVSDDGRAAGYHAEIQGSAWLSLEASERLFGLSPLSHDEALQASLGGVPHSAPLGIEVSMAVHTAHSTFSSPNVIGVVRGTDPALAEEYVVYTAHLDHVGVIPDEDGGDEIYNGMYDNAMGVALMLETAQYLPQHQRSARRCLSP